MRLQEPHFRRISRGAFAALLICAPTVGAQRIEGSVDLGGVALRYADTLNAGAATLTPRAVADWGRGVAEVSGTYSQFTSGGWSTQGALSGSLFTPFASGLLGELAGFWRWERAPGWYADRRSSRQRQAAFHANEGRVFRGCRHWANVVRRGFLECISRRSGSVDDAARCHRDPCPQPCRGRLPQVHGWSACDVLDTRQTRSGRGAGDPDGRSADGTRRYRSLVGECERCTLARRALRAGGRWWNVSDRSNTGFPRGTFRLVRHPHGHPSRPGSAVDERAAAAIRDGARFGAGGCNRLRDTASRRWLSYAKSGGSAGSRSGDYRGFHWLDARAPPTRQHRMVDRDASHRPRKVPNEFAARWGRTGSCLRASYPCSTSSAEKLACS